MVQLIDSQGRAIRVFRRRLSKQELLTVFLTVLFEALLNRRGNTVTDTVKWRRTLAIAAHSFVGLVPLR
jgi:hypothetical protein